MSLHYLVKLESSSDMYYPLVVTETPEFIPPELWPPNSPDLNPVDYYL